MSSTLLHQAVELAQAGQREQARQLILQFLQGEPNNEVAWLWLASVASDQAEYVHALNEVLRINPENQRARNLLDEYYQQQPAPPDATSPSTPGTPAESPYARPPDQPSRPPARPSGPPPVQSYVPPTSDQWQQAPPLQSYAPQGYAQMPPAQQQPAYTERERRGRGCLGCGPGCLGLSGCAGCGGCGQGCLLALLILVVVPMIACGALSYSAESLGPFDLVLGVLPGEFGRKTIEIDTRNYTEAQGQDFTISASVPRSWVLVDPDDATWEVLAEMTDEVLPFAQASRSWLDEANAANLHPIILDMNYAYLSEGGDLTKLELAGLPESGDYRCATIEGTYGSDAYTYDNDLCGYRVDEVVDHSGGAVFESVDPPAQTHIVTFYTPATSTLALKWTLTLPAGKVYDWYESDIDTLIESVEIRQ